MPLLDSDSRGRAKTLPELRYSNMIPVPMLVQRSCSAWLVIPIATRTPFPFSLEQAESHIPHSAIHNRDHQGRSPWLACIASSAFIWP